MNQHLVPTIVWERFVSWVDRSYSQTAYPVASKWNVRYAGWWMVKHSKELYCAFLRELEREFGLDLAGAIPTPEEMLSRLDVLWRLEQVITLQRPASGVLGWHFHRADTLRNGEPVPPPGKWLELDTSRWQLQPCCWGLHASERVIDALPFAPSCMLSRVELAGQLVSHGETRQNDKLAASRRRIVATVDLTPTLLIFARRCALAHFTKWPREIKQLLETGKPADWEQWWSCRSKHGLPLPESPARESVLYQLLRCHNLYGAEGAAKSLYKSLQHQAKQSVLLSLQQEFEQMCREAFGDQQELLDKPYQENK